MAVMDEFKEERENIKKGPFKQRMSYFWTYYKWYVIVPVVIVITLVSYIHYMITKPESILSGALLNTQKSEAPTLLAELTDDFCKEYEIDTPKYEFNISATLSYNKDDTTGTSNYDTLMTLMTWSVSGSADFIGGDVDSLLALAYSNGYLIDLREMLTDADFAKYEPYFLYIDQALIDAKSEASMEDGVISPAEYPDCRKPEEMEKPVPLFIDVSQCKELANLYEDDTTIVLGITPNTSHMDTMSDFLEYLLQIAE